MRITSTSLSLTREPLAAPFGFKGGSLTELWQVVCRVETESGLAALGHGVQSVLWSDGAVFAALGQERGNAAMLETTRFAQERLRGRELAPPPRMLEELLPETLAFARTATGREDLRTTFALNALTPVDWALWRLWARTREDPSFRAVTAPYTDYLRSPQSVLGTIPLLSYNTPEAEAAALAREGRFLFKIKIGANPGGRGDLGEMLAWDKERFSRLHQLLKDVETPWTDCGHPLYYLDANGRYDTLDRLEAFLDHADKIGALERICLLEEPFPEDRLLDVSKLPVTVAGDESAHSAADAVMLMERYGYRAMALKPIAKTLSVSLAVLQAAGERGVPCFCADLTVNPLMAGENRLFAAYLDPLPGLRAGVCESNGAQNYKNWEKLCREDPAFGKPWNEEDRGVSRLTPEYFECDGGIWP